MTRPRSDPHAPAAELEAKLAAEGIAQWSLDIASGTVIASDFCRSWLGWIGNDVVDEGDLLSAIHPDDRAIFISALAGCAESGDPFHLVHRALPNSGDEIQVETHGLAIVGNDGVTVRIAAVTATLLTA